MLIELKEFQVKGSEIFNPVSYPEDGMYLAVDGMTTFIVSVSIIDNRCIGIPVPLEIVKRYEVENAVESTKTDLNIGLYAVQNKLDKLLSMAEINDVPFENRPPEICISERGFVEIIKAFTNKE